MPKLRPGGQNVNAVFTAVQLRFDVRQSSSLPKAIRHRVETLAGRRATQEGVIVITARRYRTQEADRRDALQRLVELVREAAEPPRIRKPTKTPRDSRRRRLEAKSKRALVKKRRGVHSDDLT